MRKNYVARFILLLDDLSFMIVQDVAIGFHNVHPQ